MDKNGGWGWDVSETETGTDEDHPYCAERGFDARTGKDWCRRRFDADEAGAITDAQLREIPFFMHFEKTDSMPGYQGDALLAPLGDADASQAANHLITRAKILAEAIPSRSFAAGANPVATLIPERNINLNDGIEFRRSDQRWPTRTQAGSRWLHSDYLKPAYFFVNRFYDRIALLGGF